MKINGKNQRTIWLKKGNPSVVQIIDQRSLPHEIIIEDLCKLEDFEIAIRDMHVRGAPLIGSAAAYGMYSAALHVPKQVDFEDFLVSAGEKLKVTRPTAVNLAYAVDLILNKIKTGKNNVEKIEIVLKTAHQITEESVEHCQKIGEFGVKLIEAIATKKPGQPINVLTHCNAGWLACIDYGTATAPIYQAHRQGINVHVWVDETRPRNQGARITAFELAQEGVPHTIIPDNVGGHLMQHNMVDLVIVGSDRTTVTGDVANKIGTYLKALAAHDNNVPFYVALPSSTFDWNLRDGVREIPIEKRDSDEVKYIQGWHEGSLKKVLLTPAESPALNYGFDVTPARLVTGLITERGICKASEEGIRGLFNA
ncbi:MAG: methylthioribose-1-phosphate isomerase [Saprospiraceae bacterium]|jgi:methylthioribose-1-phosphate isomerase